jgi:hypothetical protein
MLNNEQLKNLGFTYNADIDEYMRRGGNGRPDLLYRPYGILFLYWAGHMIPVFGYDNFTYDMVRDLILALDA